MLPDFQFRKSTFSNDEAECVEVALNISDIVALRDSKVPDGPILRVSPAPWDAFREALVTGTFDR
ncbi:DUF397 domain-containing protein [Streptomyces syringium]|uniref:DUF397 domain-containing protein n=1 Tax=Streptomyces syringium TaxID=76729 RepID=A0ABS4Y1X5_9ACTN|nr:DUF397 domain-containing protein [Streptomyces syringium]MBP2402761.1 hypothetical protein [Streptomyces syringium]SPE49648.1 hypothetical protein SNS2_1339 [Streptomyces netropsis]